MLGVLVAALACACSGDAASSGGPSAPDAGPDTPEVSDAATTDGPGDASQDASGVDLSDVADERVDTPINTEEARFRLVHAAVGAPEISVTFDGDEVAHLRYGEATSLFGVAPGTHSVAVQAMGSTGPPAVLWQSELTVPGGTTVSAVLAGDGTLDGGLRALFVSGATDTPPPGQASVRFVHALAEPTALSVDLWDDGMDDARLELGQPVGSRAVRVPAGEPLVARLRREGEPLVRFTVGPFESGEAVTFIVMGRSSPSLRPDEGPTLLPLGSSSAADRLEPDPWLAVLHASPDAAQLDLFEGARELLDGLAFGELVTALQVAPDLEELSVFPTDWQLSSSYPPEGDDLPWATDLGVRLVRGERYLVVVAGLVGADGDDALRLMTLHDAFDSTSAQALGRLLNAAPGGLALSGDASALPAWDDLFDGGSLELGESTPEAGLPLPTGLVVLALGHVDCDDEVQLFETEVASRARLFFVATAAPGNARGALLPQPLVVFGIDSAQGGEWRVEALNRVALE